KVAIILCCSGAVDSNEVELWLVHGANISQAVIHEYSLKMAVWYLTNPAFSEIMADVSYLCNVHQYFRYARTQLGHIDAFFDNSGIEGIVKPITEYPEEAFDKLLSINVKGVWLGIKYVLPEMNDGGSIINTSSVAGLMGFGSMSAYVTSKHAVIGITRTVALE